MKTKLLLIGILLLSFTCVAATNVEYITLVSTHNGSVTIQDQFNKTQTYSCESDQNNLEFRGKQTYAVTLEDAKNYLTNISCSLQNTVCQLPEERIAALQAAIIEASNTNMGTTKTELLNQLPALVIASANLTSLDTCIGQYGMCQADYSVCLNENDAYKSNNTIYLVASLICLFLAAVLFLNNEYGFIEKLKQKQREGGGGGQ